MEYLSEPQQCAKEWHVVYCRPLQEWQVARKLQEYLGLVVYLPVVKRQFRGKIQHAPLFPCYLFVYAGRQSMSLSRINAIPGVLRILTLGDPLQTVPDDVIEELRQRVDLLNARGGLINHSFRPGDTVRLKNGPFSGLDATFQGPVQPSERVRVLIEFLGRPQELQVAASKLEPVQITPPLRLERRTRGRGRAIRSRLASITGTFPGDAEAGS